MVPVVGVLAAGGGLEQWLLPVLVVGCVAFVFWRMSRVARRRARDATDVPRRPDDRPRPPDPALTGSAESLLVEIQEFGREIEGRIDTKIRYLEKLIEEAERAIERLSAAVERERGEAAGEEAHRAAEVRRLAGEGLDPPVISERTGMPVGEVELILKLERENGDRQGGRGEP